MLLPAAAVAAHNYPNDGRKELRDDEGIDTADGKSNGYRKSEKVSEHSTTFGGVHMGWEEPKLRV